MEGWRTKTLGEITSFMAKGIPPKYVEREGSNIIHVLNQKCNRDFRISYAESRLHNNAVKKAPESKMLKPGDVLINSTGAGTAGRVAQIWNVPVPTTIDGHMILLRPTEEIDSLYYGYAVKSNQALIESYAEGSTGQTEINKERLKNETVISFPTDKNTQRVIARTLAAIDEKIEENERINKNLQAQAQAFFLHLFADNESVIPASIADVALNVTDGVHNTVHDDPDGEYLLLSCKNIKGGSLSIGTSERRINAETFEKLRRRTKLAKGDVLISSVGTVGELLLVNTEPSNYEFQRSVAMVKPNPDIVSPVYLYEALLSQKAELINAAHGAVQQCLFISDIAGFPIGIPTQDDLLTFDEVVTPMFDTITANEAESIRLAALRDALLPKLMSGEIDVSDLDL